MWKESKPAFACKLSNPELRKRKETVLAKLKNLVIEKTELENGYAYKFKNSDDMIDLLTDFIKTERSCCEFFHFSLFVSSDQYIVMHICGTKGIQDFIKVELEL